MSNEADIKKWASRIKRYQKEPWLFFYEVLGIKEIDPGQMEFLRAYADPSQYRIAVKASTGTGKTFEEAGTVLHFISCFGEPENPAKGIVTSIDGNNMEANLWAEISRLYNRSEYLKQFLGLHTEKLFMKKYPMDWFVERRTWDKKAAAGTNDGLQDALGLAGHHAKYSLFLVDESGGVPSGVVSAGERTLVNKPEGCFLKLIQMGNPTNRSGPLWDAFNEEPVPGKKKVWTTITMTGDPDDPNRSRRADEEWCRNLINKYGRDYPYVQVYVLGEFPSQDFNAFLSEEDVEEAFNRDYELNMYNEIASRLGVDISYEGSDETWDCARQGQKVFDFVEYRVPLSSPTIGRDMANLSVPRINLLGLEDVFLDATGGYGNAYMEAMRTQGKQVIAIKFNQKASLPDQYANIRTEMYWRMSRWVKEGGALPRTPGLKEELCATKYTIHKHKMVAEPKEIVKVRLKGKSPNRADALCLTFAIPDKQSAKMRNSESGIVGEMEGFGDSNPLSNFMRPPQRKQGGMRGFSDYGRK